MFLNATPSRLGRKPVSVTGLSVGDSPGNPVNFSMRGFTNNQLRLLYDGLLLGPAQMTSRPRDTWNLDRIEILKGPASVLYGEGALGGAINFVTKRPLREDHITTDALLSIGSFNTLRTAVGSGGPPQGFRVVAGLRGMAPEALAEAMLDNAVLKDLASKNF